MSQQQGTLQQRLFAWALARFHGKYEAVVAARKPDLFAGLSGTVVEIGPGAGVNLPYYPRGIQWIGVEPNPFMDRYLRRQATELGMEIEVRRGSAEHLPMADASVDAVVSTLVLCSVSDPQAVLREVLRVLKPGGRFTFIEHVGAPRETRLRRWQQRVKPFWRRLADGCEPDRETWVALEQAGFGNLSYERFNVLAPIISPQIIGVAIKE